MGHDTMKVILTTHDRKPAYVHDTLESMFRNDDMKGADIHVLVHSQDSSFLGAWEQSTRITVHTLTDEQLKEKNGLARRAKCAHVKRLALEMADDEVLLLEDDCVFAPFWWTKFQAALEAYGPNRQWAMIALCYHLASNQVGLVPWDPSTYYGMVSLYLGSVIRKEAIKALGPRDNPDWDKNNPGVGGDVRLQQMLMKRRKDFKLFALRPQLVYHTGEVSSIGSRSEDSRRRSPGKPML